MAPHHALEKEFRQKALAVAIMKGTSCALTSSTAFVLLYLAFVSVAEAQSKTRRNECVVPRFPA